MVGSTEISIFEVLGSSTTVCCILDMLRRACPSVIRCQKVESQRVIRELKL